MPNVVDRLTDTSKYTGAHKERFDADGKGKGKAGRVNLVVSDGSTSSPSRNHEINAVSTERLHKPVVKPVTDAEKFGTTPNKITLYVYGDKHHAGEKVILHAKKFPSWKQFNDLTLKMIPTGKPKCVIDKQGNEIKALDQFKDSEKYLVITAFDKSKMNKEKVPTAF